MDELCRYPSKENLQRPMKRIVHVSTMHPSSDTRVFKNECRSLAKEGYEVIFCVPHPKEETVEGVRIVPVPKFSGFIDRIFGAPKKAVQIAESLHGDLYHFHDPELLFVMAALAKRGKKVIWDAHENYTDTIYQFNSLKIKPISLLGAIFFGYFELKYAKKYFKGVVTVTERMAERYRKLNIPTAVVGNFSDTSKFKKPDFLKKNEEVKFISSGMQLKVRGVVEIAAAFNLLKSVDKVELCYAGKVKPDDLEEEIRAELDASKQRKVKFTGELSWSDLINVHLPSSHVAFVLFDTSDPNNCNGLPNRFFEAWSNGLPVITTAGTQVARITEEVGGGVIIPDNSSDSIAKAMKFFIDHPGGAIEMGKKAYSAVVKKYSWKDAFNNLSDLYRKILSKSL